VTFAGYPGSTGLWAMDYRLTDRYLDPPGLFDHCYSEASVRDLDSFWCYDPEMEAPPVNRLPALERGQVTFGCLNNFCKVNAGTLRLWARTMRAVPGSRLLLLAPEGLARRNLVDLMEADGVAPERVEFIDRTHRQEYLAMHNRIDIGLDTIPYNGHTTSLDAMWMGVPVVTLVGRTVVGRAGLSQLTNIGLTELIGNTPEEFARIAVSLSSNLQSLAWLRSTLRERMRKSPVCDTQRFARTIETAYRTMWLRWCERR